MNRLNQVLKNWQVVQLGDVADFINGDRGKNYPSQQDFVNTGIPFINAGHIQNGNISFESMNYISQERFNLLSSGKVRANDILYCLRGSLGKTAIVQAVDKGAIASSLVIIRTSDKIDTKYLYHYLVSPRGQGEIGKYDNGSSQPNLSAKSVKQYKIPLPPLEEQKRIAAILDKADAIRRKRKEAIALTEELLRSTFLDMFGDPVTNPKGWEKVKIKEIVKIHYGKALKTQDRIESGNFPVFGANGQIGFHDVCCINTPTLIIGRKGSAGEVTYTDCGGWVIDTAFYVEIETPEKIDIRYFYYVLKYSNLQKLSITTSIPGLNRDSLYNQQIPLPPLEKQKRIAAILDKADAIQQKRKEAIALSDNLFASLLQKAFRGEL